MAKKKDFDDTAPATKADIEHGISRVLNRLDKQDKRFDELNGRFDHIDRQMKVDYERTTWIVSTLGELEDDLKAVNRVVKTTADDVKLLKAWTKQNKTVLTDHEERLELTEQRLGIAS